MRLVLATLLLFSTSLSFAQSVDYTTEPEEISLTIESGGESYFDLTLNIADHQGSVFYDFRFNDRYLEGDEIPITWIDSELDSYWYFHGDPDTPPPTSLITITVPPKTPSGIYKGTLFVKVNHGFHGFETLPPGDGVPITITIPSTCFEDPILHVESDISYLWPPNGKYHDIVFSGTATTGDGCTLSDIDYVVEDEYGELNSSGTLSANEDGIFALTNALIARRNGQDKDGRLYRVTFTVENENGTADTTLNIIVPHDQRKKP